MYTLMREPTILPTSKTTVDLSTIKAHLLSDPTDPFNRMPLKIEECKPGRSRPTFLLPLTAQRADGRGRARADLELRTKIETYLADRRAARRTASTATAGGGDEPTTSAMDLS